MSQLKVGRTSRKDKAIKSVKKLEEDKKVRVNFMATKKFHKKIKQKALDEDISITDLIIFSINKYMSK